MPRRFEDELLDALEREVGGRAEAHLSDVDLDRLVAGRADERDAERVGLHLASCPACRAKLDVRRSAAVARPRAARTVALRVAGALSLVLSIVALSISVGHIHGIPAARVTPASGARTTLAAPSAALSPTVAELTPATFVRDVQAYQAYPAHRAAAYTIGLLRRYGVPLDAPALAFASATVYVAEPGDTWELVAERTLGDAALWPIVVLLNLELTSDGAFVPAGTYVRVPRPAVEEGVR